MNTPRIRDFQGKHVHMIGIGGSSMSGLAEMLAEKGYCVSGSDRADGYALAKLRDMGIEVHVGQKAENVHGADLVIYTAAILPDNPEWVEMQRLGLPSMERAELLGQLMEGYPQAIGVCGTHGKTTTTSMLSQVLVECGLDPTVHIGGQLDAIGGSTRIGKGSAFLAEACEFKASFHHMHPTMAVVTNIEEDHLDFYKDLDDIQASFRHFLHLLPADGLAIGNGDDPRVRAELDALTCRHQTFGMDTDNDWYPGELHYDSEGHGRFDLVFQGKKVCAVTLKVPGAFNVMHALAALAAAYALGADMEKAAQSLTHFVGAHRRFELTDTIEGVEIFHDYGHNPAEMRNALDVARLRCKGRLWAVMQPHTYSRVKRLFDDYLTCTERADFTLVTDICAAREKDPGDINSGMLVDGMKAHGIDAVWTPSFDDTENYLRAHWMPGDLVITMGCGDINLLNVQMSCHEKEKNGK